MNTDYEKAVNDYTDALKKYKSLEEGFLSGEFLAELLAHSKGELPKMEEQFRVLVDQVRAALEDVNTKLTTAKNAIRAAVSLAPTQQRGAKGAPTTLTYGPFTVNSVTHRWFDPESLLRAAMTNGIYKDLLGLTGVDKEGKTYHYIQPKWVVDFEHIFQWLKANNHEKVIDAAYDEKEETPRVSGGKPLAFLGDKIG